MLDKLKGSAEQRRGDLFYLEEDRGRSETVRGFLISGWKGLIGSMPVNSKISNRKTIPNERDYPAQSLELPIQVVGLAVEIYAGRYELGSRHRVPPQEDRHSFLTPVGPPGQGQIIRNQEA